MQLGLDLGPPDCILGLHLDLLGRILNQTRMPHDQAEDDGTEPRERSEPPPNRSGIRTAKMTIGAMLDAARFRERNLFAAFRFLKRNANNPQHSVGRPADHEIFAPQRYGSGAFITNMLKSRPISPHADARDESCAALEGPISSAFQSAYIDFGARLFSATSQKFAEEELARHKQQFHNPTLTQILIAEGQLWQKF
jgi:hypothetical protein